MPIFSHTRSYLGIDLGSSLIKLVELKDEKGESHLITYGFAEKPPQGIESDSQSTPENLANLIKKICKKAQVISSKALAALPTFSVFSSIINLPEMSKKELEGAIRVEAKKFIPMPLEEIILDWKLLERGAAQDKNLASPKLADQKESQNTRLLLTAAPKNLVKRYIEIFKLAGFELLSLETESFSLARSLLGHDFSPVMILDMGTRTTDIIIVENRIPVFSRSIDVGGITITRALEDSLGIDFRRAEQFKRDIGVIIESSSGEGISRIIQESFSSVVNEIHYCFDLYRSRTLEKRGLEKIILSGGSALLPGVSEYLSKLLKIKVYVGNPWSRVSYPEELKPVLEELGPSMAVAVGLALREIE